MTKEEKEVLCELVFLGNWVVNSHRLFDEGIEKYKELSLKIEKLHRQLSVETLPRDLTEFYLNKLNRYIDEYDNEVCFPILAEKLAKANFPENPKAKGYCGSIHMQIDAKHIFEKELLEKGVSIVSIDIPDILERLERRRQIFRKR